MLKISKIKDVARARYPRLKKMVTPTTSIILAFSECTIHHNNKAYELKERDHLILNGPNTFFYKQPQNIQFTLIMGQVFGIFDETFFNLENVENVENLYDESFKDFANDNIKLTTSLAGWSMQPKLSLPWGIPKK